MGWQILPEYPNGTIGNTCLVCNSILRPRTGNKADGHEYALSTGVFIDFEGFVVICESCITEVAHMLGFLPEHAIDQLRKNNRELGRQNTQLRKELGQAKQAIKSLKEIFHQ